MTALEAAIIEAAREYTDAFLAATLPDDARLLAAEVDLVQAVNNERAARRDPV